MAAFHQLRRAQKIPASKKAVWDFIKSPHNLKEITPDYMGFEITSENDSTLMYPGLIITYNVSPMWGIKLTWVTEITQIVDQQYFCDEQRHGPYKMWHHEHHLEEIEGGVLMKDIVSYIPPMGILGTLANSLFIRRQLESIFDYRIGAVERRFGKFSA